MFRNRGTTTLLKSASVSRQVKERIIRLFCSVLRNLSNGNLHTGHPCSPKQASHSIAAQAATASGRRRQDTVMEDEFIAPNGTDATDSGVPASVAGLRQARRFQAAPSSGGQGAASRPLKLTTARPNQQISASCLGGCTAAWEPTFRLGSLGYSQAR